MKNEVTEESEIVRREKRIFAELPVPKAVAIMVVPVSSQGQWLPDIIIEKDLKLPV